CRGTGTPTSSESSPTAEATETSSPTPESAETPFAISAPFPEEAGEVDTLAPELMGITGWLNSEPLALEELRGQVVLIDFWTYTCVNCIRTFPYLKEWHDKYSDNGLVIIGVHSPEFEFEKKAENVVRAIEHHGLGWPVAQDNDFETWMAFNNHFWPAKYLLDEHGVIRYRHFGEGAYDETERNIRGLLEEAGYDVSHISINPDPGPRLDPQARGGVATGQTRELYAGLTRNRFSQVPYLGNPEYYTTSPGTVTLYEDPGNHINHLFYLHGIWTNGDESIIHARETEELEDYIALKFYGTSVNVVINFEGGDPFRVDITLDGDPLPVFFRGADIVRSEDGSTFIEVNEARMYNLVQSPEYGGRELRLSSNSDRFSVFAFTFGSYDTGP
ncbi:MAG: redoxin family protein, partial [Dehalococcoidia bacterium]